MKFNLAIVVLAYGFFGSCAEGLRELESKAKGDPNTHNFQSGEAVKITKDEVSIGESKRQLKETDDSDLSPLSKERTSLPSLRKHSGIVNLGENIVFFNKVTDDTDFSESTPFAIGNAEIIMFGTLKRLAIRQKISGRESSSCDAGSFCLDWNWFLDRSKQYVYIPKQFLRYEIAKKKNSSIKAVIKSVEKIQGDEYLLDLAILGMGVLTSGEIICSTNDSAEESARCPKKMDLGDELSVEYNGIAPPKDDATAELFKIHKE